MSTISFTMNTKSRKPIDNEGTNNCSVHNRKPSLYEIIAGTRSQSTYFVATCDHQDCNKITSEGAEEIVAIWNKWNPNR